MSPDATTVAAAWGAWLASKADGRPGTVVARAPPGTQPWLRPGRRVARGPRVDQRSSTAGRGSAGGPRAAGRGSDGEAAADEVRHAKHVRASGLCPASHRTRLVRTALRRRAPTPPASHAPPGTEASPGKSFPRIFACRGPPPRPLRPKAASPTNRWPVSPGTTRKGTDLLNRVDNSTRTGV